MSDAPEPDEHPEPTAVALDPPPCTLVIFGAAGDLTRRKLLPALWNLALDGALPERLAVVGFARREMNDAAFRSVAREGVERHSRRSIDEALWGRFERSLFYVTGSFEDAGGYRALAARLTAIEADLGLPGHRIVYLSVPPSQITASVTHLAAAGILRRSSAHEPFSRVIVEKPIGHDLASARAINREVARGFDESQVFRIDHYLGKETVQSLLVLRFANSIFEPLWNQKYIDHVQITVAEEEGVGTRAGYYEEAGALRDMVQNHILQLLCLVAMEPPWSLDPDVVRDQKMAVMNCLRPIGGDQLAASVVRAQYGAGVSHGLEVAGYRAEPRVGAASTTETFVAIRAFVDNWRWAGVPFYLRTGKRLPRRASEIAVQFKDVPQVLFNAGGKRRLDANVLALRIQPDEGMSLRVATKVPGPRVRIDPVALDFRYGATFEGQSPEAYERLLLDVMLGDATLFMRRDAVEAAWRWVDWILEGWSADPTPELPTYPAGSWGPAEAEELIRRDGRTWRRP